ncbi:hypothetical protein FB451DRAFT_1438049 [Mycena latifolia]|nr:hypothetical protein FB451DRAFT_1438049 [Mycena latifolia]
MPREPAIGNIQLNSIVTCLNTVLPLSNDLHDGLGTPFMQAISNTTLNLLSAVQNVKNNKDKCVHLMKDIHEILFAIARLHMQSEPQGSLLPSTLDHIGKFTNTLHKIHTFVEGQQEKSRFKHFLHQSEMRILFKECRAGLQQALELFKIETSAAILANALKMQEKAEKLHEELLDLISNMTEGISDRSSSVPEFLAALSCELIMFESSISFGLLPAKPKIFHGRESEFQEILQNFSNKEVPRVAILGTGGIGKTSLAKAALHHPGISANYENKLFVACDSATTSIELAALVGSNIGFKRGRDLTQPVVQHCAHGPPCLLVLDNLETSWEPIETRARQTFIDITDNDHDNEEITQLLELTDNMLLAVNLLANLVDYEGCSGVLAWWKTENTYMLSEGCDKSMNLNSSITISLSCPRMTSGAKSLLSLLSILPDGLSNVELLQSVLPVPDILTCKAVLLQTSLAYTDSKRLKVPVPIREYMQHIHPPSPSLVQPLRKHFHSLLDLYRTHFGVQINGMADQINSNLRNIHHILLPCLHPENPELRGKNYCILTLSSFRRFAAHEHSELMDQIPPLLSHLADPRLEINFTIEVLSTTNYYPIPNLELLIDRAVHHLDNLNDPSLACKFYRVAEANYHDRKDDKAMSLQFYDKALMLARSCGNVEEQAHILDNLATWKRSIGDYEGAQIHARDAEERSQMCGNIRLVMLLKLRERSISQAKELFQATLNSQWGKDVEAVAYTMARLADVTCWPSAEIKWSSRWQVVYLAHSTKSQSKVNLYKAFQFLGDRFMLQGDEDTAHSLFEVALEAFTEMDIHRSRADCMLRLGDIAKQSGDLVKAVGLWKDALPLFARSSQAKEVAKIDTRLAAADADILQQHKKSLQYLHMLDAPTTLLHAGLDELNIEVVEDRDPTSGHRIFLPLAFSFQFFVYTTFVGDCLFGLTTQLDWLLGHLTETNCSRQRHALQCQDGRALAWHSDVHLAAQRRGLLRE